MRGRPILTLALCGSLAGCGGFDANSLNPFNWFGDDVVVEVAPDGQFIDPRPLVDQITKLEAERTPGGVIFRVTGLPPTQGFWSVGLVPSDPEFLPDENGVLSFDFRAFPPPTPQAVGTPASREVVTAYYLTDQVLDRIRTIEFRAERNTRSIRP